MPTGNTAEILKRYAETVSAAPNRHAAFVAAQEVAQTLIGHSLFTIMRFDAGRMAVQRIHSSNAEAYPVGGCKPKRATQWARQVLQEGKVFIGHDSDDIRRAFDDSDLILSLGLNAVLNVPVRSAGAVVGTMNLLDRTAHYTHESAELGAAIARHLAAAIDAK